MELGCGFSAHKGLGVTQMCGREKAVSGLSPGLPRMVASSFHESEPWRKTGFGEGSGRSVLDPGAGSAFETPLVVVTWAFEYVDLKFKGEMGAAVMNLGGLSVAEAGGVSGSTQCEKRVSRLSQQEGLSYGESEKEPPGRRGCGGKPGVRGCLVFFSWKDGAVNRGGEC